MSGISWHSQYVKSPLSSWYPTKLCRLHRFYVFYILSMWHHKLTSEPPLSYTGHLKCRLCHIKSVVPLEMWNTTYKCDSKDRLFRQGVPLPVLSILQTMYFNRCLSVAFSFVRLHVYRMGSDILFLSMCFEIESVVLSWCRAHCW